ncbi:LysR substrate-binding domain-containing protein [Celerinatantimonas sp. MCCC 1A17872]|uniref:LysR substrate-binding domain-containing protein n=1 Tax=Celerinatantimonas sp. MCCC 1A17872 TaxID=3177514 RepID=UPI0038C5D6C3
MLSRITQRQLEYFIASGEAGSILGASENIFVSSSSISAAITHIEAELGAQLFVRHHAQGITLTPVGQQVMTEAKLIIEQMNNLYTIASESLNSVRGPIRIGCMETLAPMLSPELIYGFGKAFPGVSVSLVEGNHEDLLNKLKTAEIDIALSYDLTTFNDLEFTPLAELPPYVMVGENHPLAEQSAVTLKDLEPYPAILLDIPYSREYFLSLYRNAGVTPEIVMKSRNSEVIRTMVANGIGYSLNNVRPKANLSQDGKRLRSLRLSGENQALSLGYVCAKHTHKTRVISAFAQRCEMFISNQYIPGMAAPSFYDPHIVPLLKTG